MREGGALILDGSVRDGRLGSLAASPDGGKGTPLVIEFRGGDLENSFGEADVAFALSILSLPSRGRLPIAFVAGSLRGADLALALFCPLVVLEPGATLGSGFGRPGSSAVYVAAARRVGTVACERLLFAAAPLAADEAARSHLAIVAGDVHGAVATATARQSTLLAVAKADLVTWPMTHDAMLALVDGC